MNQIESLKKLTSRRELAVLLGIEPKFLSYVLYIDGGGVESQYRSFEISKKNGGVRVINSPSPKLKDIQRRLSNLLQDCLDELFVKKNEKAIFYKEKNSKSHELKIKVSSQRVKQPSLSHGFVRRRSIITNAMMHINRKIILNIDIEDFFGSLNFGRVRGFFIKNNDFQLHPDVATAIAQIACYNDCLPQGSPCSPVISNLISHILDIRLAKLAKRNSCIYTRYADDITFSTRMNEFPKSIAYISDGNVIVGRELKKEISRAKFSLNNKKTRIQFKDSRQDVTGLVVNKKPNVKKEYWREVKSQCNKLFKNGEYLKFIDKDTKVVGSINELEGRLNFINQVDAYNRLREKKPLNPSYVFRSESKNNLKDTSFMLTGRERVFSKFLFYKKFYANDKVTFVCEGKTDNIYMKAAINKLAVDYPELASVKGESGEYELHCDFVEYSKRTRFLLELYGGSDYLSGFIKNYKSKCDSYGVSKQDNPVIVLVDNDEGGKKPIEGVNAVKSYTVVPEVKDKGNNQAKFRKADFIHVTENLYVVFTPLGKEDKPTDIESLFDDVARKIEYKGKCFNTVNERDEKVDLSKNAFASHVVKLKKSEISFDGFRPLLDRVMKVIKHYEEIKEAKVAPA